MKKEQTKGEYERYKTVIQKIEELVKKSNQELNLKGDNCIEATPDQIVVPITHKDGKRVKHVFDVHFLEGQEKLGVYLQFDKGEKPKWYSADEIIKNLVECGSKFESTKKNIIQECIDKSRERQGQDK